MKKIFVFSILAILAIFAIPTGGASILAAGPIVGGGLSLRQLEDFANGNLSSFDGENYEGEQYEGEQYEGEQYDGYDDEFDGYTGYNDDFVDFGGFNKSFANAADSGRLFVMTLTNPNAASRTALLCPGYLYYPGSTMNGAVLDGAFNDTTGAAGLTGGGSPKTVNEFFAFIGTAPVQVAGIKIESTVAAQVSQQLIIEHLSPFKTLEQHIINLGSYQNENTFRDKIVTIPTPNLVLSSHTKIYLPIVGTSTCTVTFLAGAVLNPAAALTKKIGRASNTFQRAGIAVAKRAAARPAGRKIAGR